MTCDKKGGPTAVTDLATVAEPGDHTARLAAAFTATRRA